MSQPSRAAVSALFLEVCDSDPRARAERLAAEHDPALRLAVEQLLRHHDAPQRLLARIDAAIDDRKPAAVGHPETIGPYRILSVLGRGGMGIVYRAEQQSPRRTVALKILASQIVPPATAARLVREAEVLGRLHHSGIAQVHEAGMFDSAFGAQPYIAMELVEGEPITRWADDHQLDPRRRVELMVKVCDAVQHAHERGVLHRDLKPANILVQTEGGEPQPKVLDFGIARCLDGDAEQWETLRTRTGQLVGTLPYMSPEQLRGNHRNIDARSDVYALGVLLYELLAGRVPLDVADKPLTEVTRLVTEVTATRLGHHNPALRGDLETIAARVLRKEPEHRYQSAAELGEDLRRYLRNEPIRARPTTIWYQLRKFTRRNRALVAGVLATTASLLVGMVATTLYAFENADLARTESELRARESRARAEADAKARELRRTLYCAELRLCGDALREPNGAGRIDQLLAGWRPSPDAAEDDLRGWEWFLLDSHVSVHRQIRDPDKTGIRPLHWRKDGRVLCEVKTAASSMHMDLVEFDPESGLRGRVVAETHRLVVPSPDGTRFCAVTRRGIQVFDYATGRSLHHIPIGDVLVCMLDWHPDIRLIAAMIAPYDEHRRPGPTELVVVDAEAETVTRRMPLRSRADVQDRLEFSSDGRWLAVSFDSESGSAVALFRTADWELVRTLLRPAVPVVLRWQPGTTRLAIGHGDGSVALCDAESGAMVTTIAAHRRRVTQMLWDHRGDQLATCSYDGILRVWNPASGRHRVAGHDAQLWRIQWSPDDRHVAAAGPSFRIWDLHRAPAVRTVLAAGRGAGHSPLAWHPDGKRLAVAVSDRTLIVDPMSGQELGEVAGHEVSFDHSGERYVFRSGTRVVACRVDVPDAQLEHDVGDRVTKVRWQPGGDHVAVVASDRIWLWKPGDATEPRSVQTGNVQFLFWHPSGNRVHFFTFGHTHGSWDLDGQLRKAIGYGGRATNAVWNPSGTCIAWPDEFSGVTIWSPPPTPRRLLHGHTDDVLCADWSPDGKRLATGGCDRAVRIWDVATWSEAIALPHEESVRSVAWSPDSRMLASQSTDGEVKVWDATLHPR